MIIYKNGYSYNIERHSPTETNKQLIERGWFIVNLINININRIINNDNDNDNDNNKNNIDNMENLILKEYDNAINKSIIWYNIKYLKCEYNSEITNEINKIKELLKLNRS